MDLVYKDTVRRIIESPRSKEQMLKILQSIPSVDEKIYNKGFADCKESIFNFLISKTKDKLVLRDADMVEKLLKEWESNHIGGI